MNSKCYCTGWSLVAGLAASVLALPSFAAALTLDEALRLAENNAPSLTAQDAKIQAASSAAIPAGDVRGRDIASVVADLRRVVNEQVKLQPGMSLSYSGQFEFLERANARLKLVVPATLLIIFVLLYLTFALFDEALLIMATLPLCHSATLPLCHSH